MAQYKEHVRVAVREALDAGVSPNDLALILASESGWDASPSVITLSLRIRGRSTQLDGIKYVDCTMHQLKYVNLRWSVAASFYTPCLANSDWLPRVEAFIRRLVSPIILSRHPARDYMILEHAFLQSSRACVPARGCSAGRLSVNGLFPEILEEVPSYLNVLNVTPVNIADASIVFEPKDPGSVRPIFL